MADPARLPVPLVVFSDDWGRHPSSCQHLVRRLLPGRDVVWVNTIGTRPPRLNLSTARRGFEKLGQWTGLTATRGIESADAIATGGVNGVGPASLCPRVLNPTMWPSFRSRLARGLNRRLLLRALSPAMEQLSRPPAVVTTLPLVADLVGRLPAARWVYYCVDDFSVWPGLDGQTLQSMEAELVGKVDVAVSVSETLQRHLAALGRPSHLLTHGVDMAHWRQGQSSDVAASLLADLPRPLVVFWGVVDRRMDVDYVAALSVRLTGGTVVLVGPQDDPDPALLHLPRVALRPAVAYDVLPGVAAEAAVLVMPYADLPVTRAMQPLKLKEYLATGKPVVVRDLPATRPWDDCLDVADSPERFAGQVIERLASGLPDGQRLARGRLDAEGWDAKAAQFAGWLDAV